jgi:hypothetical protein
MKNQLLKIKQDMVDCGNLFFPKADKSFRLMHTAWQEEPHCISISTPDCLVILLVKGHIMFRKGRRL